MIYLGCGGSFKLLLHRHFKATRHAIIVKFLPTCLSLNAIILVEKRMPIKNTFHVCKNATLLIISGGNPWYIRVVCSYTYMYHVLYMYVPTVMTARALLSEKSRPSLILPLHTARKMAPPHTVASPPPK